MELTANDIRNYKFPSQMRGYDKEEVDNIMEEVAAALEACKQETLTISKELESVNIQLTSLKQFEDTIKGAAIDARRNADTTIANAKTEGQQILTKARAEAETIITSRGEEISKIEKQIAKLQHARQSYLSKVRDMISSHMEIIEEIITEEPKSIPAPLAPQPKRKATPPQKRAPNGGIEVLDSNEVSRNKRETVATEPSKLGGIKTEDVQAADPEFEKLASESGKIDAEMAAALEKYAMSKSGKILRDEVSPVAEDSINVNAMVETDRLAEEFPPEFITQNSGGGESAQPVDTDNAAKKPDLSENDLSSALDDVVKTFEEKMDEASGEK